MIRIVFMSKIAFYMACNDHVDDTCIQTRSDNHAPLSALKMFISKDVKHLHQRYTIVACH